MEPEFFYRKVIKLKHLSELAVAPVDIITFYRVEKRTLKSVTLREVATQIVASYGGRLLATPSTRSDAARGCQIRRIPRKDGLIELERYVWLSPWNGQAIEVRQ